MNRAVKGLILSSIVFCAYVCATALLSHALRVERHSRLFVPALAVAAPLYLALFGLTSGDLGFLPPAWQASRPWLDALFGLAALVLNAHSYMDYFFGFNGGFSTSLMLMIHRGGDEGKTSEEIIAAYHAADGMDKIYGWRLPRLEQTGYVRIDAETQVCTLTSKGRSVAHLTRALKTALNLGKGG
jgi:hypothetical protein